MTRFRKDKGHITKGTHVAGKIQVNPRKNSSSKKHGISKQQVLASESDRGEQDYDTVKNDRASVTAEEDVCASSLANFVF